MKQSVLDNIQTEREAIRTEDERLGAASFTAKRQMDNGAAYYRLASTCYEHRAEDRAAYLSLAVSLSQEAVIAYSTAQDLGATSVLPDKGKANYLAALCQWERRHLSAALTLANAALADFTAIKPKEPNEHARLAETQYLIAEILYLEEEYDLAEAAVRKAIKAYGEAAADAADYTLPTADCYHTYARICLRIENYEKATRFCNEAIKRYNEAKKGHRNKDIVLRLLQAEVTSAEITSFTHSVRAFVTLKTREIITETFKLSDEKRRDQASRVRGKAQYVCAVNDFRREYRGGMSQSVGEALSTSQALSAAHPDDPVYREDYAQTLVLQAAVKRKEGCYDAAVKALQCAVHHLLKAQNGDEEAYYPDLAAAYFDLGLIYVHLHDYADARDALLSAIDRSRKDRSCASAKIADKRLAWEYYHLGELYLTIRRKETALAYYRAAFASLADYGAPIEGLTQNVNRRIRQIRTE